MLKQLLIAGAGGFGREILYYAGHVPASARDWEIAGFLDDDEGALAGFDCGHGIVGSIRGYQSGPNDVVALTIGDPRTKLAVAEALLAKGARFATIIHPTAFIGPRVKLGQGCIICPHVCIPCDATLGDFVHVNSNSTVAHDTVIGDGVTLSGHCDVTGAARLGRGVFLGSHASVLPSVKVGDFAKVGAGTVAAIHVKAGVTIFGVPAQVIS